jgi:acyl-CoA thioesterase-1
MRHYVYVLLLLSLLVSAQQRASTQAKTADYLRDITTELVKPWPHNRTINLVFHGHSVPAGYFKTPEVRSLESYPFVVLKALKQLYPRAVINVIVTARGGETSLQGCERFARDVLPHKPDVLFIDYALNDVSAGLQPSREAWEKMIRAALANRIKVILLTPSPDLRYEIQQSGNELEAHADQIRRLARKYEVGLVDSYQLFKKIRGQGQSLDGFMSQVNHPNGRGHRLIADGVLTYFK